MGGVTGPGAHLIVEAVEKPFFSRISDKKMARIDRAISVFGLVDPMRTESTLGQRSRPGRRLSACPPRFPLPTHRIPMMRQLFDVMDEAIELPLRINLLLASQRKAVEPFVVPEIAEHRFDGGETLAV